MPEKKTLRQLREERGLSREQLAIDLGVKYGTLVNIELGRNLPRVDVGERIYRFFGVPLESIDWYPQDTNDPKRTPQAA